jgi:hypothetical protein
MPLNFKFGFNLSGQGIGGGSGVPVPPNTLRALVGQFFLNGVDMTPTTAYVLPAALGTFALTGVAATLTSTAASDAAETTAFLARADAITTVGATERAAYKALINGLVSDGIFAKLDVLFVFATDTSAHALLNLVSSTYTASLVNAPTFTADRGYTGNGTSTEVLTTFNPSTASSPHFVQNSAHISAWNLTNSNDNGGLWGCAQGGHEAIIPSFSGGDTYLRVNDGAGAQTTVDPRGFFLGNRDSSTGRQGYQNGSALGAYGSVSSVAVPNFAFAALGDTAGEGGFSSQQIAMASAGGSMNSTEQGNFYSRLRTYMTAVGVP